MSVHHDSNKQTQLSDKGRRQKKIRTIVYCIAAVLAVGGGLLCAKGISDVFIAVVAAFWIAVFTYIIGLEQKRKQEDERGVRLGLIKLPSVASEYHDQDYRAIASAYKHLGFRNVTTVNLHDLRTILVKKTGTTECVTIGGKKAGINEWYGPDAEVRITYHRFAE